MTLFTPPMMTQRERKIFALIDHYSNCLWERVHANDIDEEITDSMESAYLERISAMDDEELDQEHSDRIGGIC